MARRTYGPPGAPLSEEEVRYREWRQKDIKGKVRDLFPSMADLWPKRHKPSKPNSFTSVTLLCYFWFMVFTEAFVVLVYCLPANYADYSGLMVLGGQLIGLWVTIHSAANWLCCRFCKSIYGRGGKNNLLPTNVAPKLSEGGVQQCLLPSSESHTVSVECNGKDESLPWRYCDKCAHNAPFRSHHCVICDACVLRRDHHCYITGVCIGHFNQRYFVVLCFYVALGSLWGLYEIITYMRSDFLPHVTSGWDYVIVWTLYKCVTGQAQWRHALMTWHVYKLWATGLTALGFFLWQMLLIPHGRTTYEVFSSRPVRSTASGRAMYRAVLGPCWGLNFVLPAGIFSKLPGDGTTWGNLKLEEKASNGKPDIL